MSTFKVGEVVRIIDSLKRSYLTYAIKQIKKSRNGAVLYLLKSRDESVARLYYESKESLLERVVT